MKIMLITPLYPPLVGGAATYFSTLKRYFTLDSLLQNDNFYLLTEWVRSSPICERDKNFVVLRILPPMNSRCSNIHILRTMMFPVHILLYFIMIFFTRVDVIHYHVSTTPRALNFVLHFFSKKKIADFRDTISPLRYMKADIAICCSRNVLARVSQHPYWRKKAVLVPVPFERIRMQEGVTVQRVAKKHGLDGMKRILIFVGSITKKGVRKGHFDLLAAFKTYSNEDRESHLVFVGGGDALGDLERTSRNLNRVHVLGALPRQETMALIQYADLLILPSKEGESLGRVVLEAIELGTKVLCSDKIVEFRHLPSEYLLSALDSKTFSEKIGTALTCNKRIDYHFQDNSPEKITIKMRDLYHKNIYLQESVIEN